MYNSYLIQKKKPKLQSHSKSSECFKLSLLSFEQAEAFHEGVRQPLQDLLPELEEERKQVKETQ